MDHWHARDSMEWCGWVILWACSCPCAAAQAVESAIAPAAQVAAQAENRLIRESSPYLQLHAHNPVDWFPWGPEALDKAKRENKPIFLSIGYSSCYWCHVMERQVFSDEEIAAYMNQNFVNIKVDREERPDLDDVYMLSLQVYFQLSGSTQGGGWPLSMFLTPDGKPIAGGTFFPPQDQSGSPGFATVLKQIHAAWTTREADVRKTADILASQLTQLSLSDNRGQLPNKQELLRLVINDVADSYDDQFGGFGFNRSAPNGPKFPSPCKIQLMQAQIAQDNSSPADSSQMVDQTLDMLARGGIRDHLAGGFHRYSTDRNWLVPHFEKMLYDNAQLAEVYLDAYRRTNRESYRRIAEETLDFVLRDMSDPNGGFYTAWDAETDGVEGQYYVWSQSEISKALSDNDAHLFAATYGLTEPQIFERGYVLHQSQSLEQTAQDLGMSSADLAARLEPMKAKLLEVRGIRKHPLLDDKVLTGWNGLMIRALARAGQVLNRQDYLMAAEKGAIMLLSNHRDENGRLLHASRRQVAQGPAYLDDYADFAAGLLALQEATGGDKWLSAARHVTDDQINLFWDQENGGFFLTAADQESVLFRPKSSFDNELPSGNSLSVQNLLRLARLTSEDSYRTYADQTLAAFAPRMQASPVNYACMALAVQEDLKWFGAPEHQAANEELVGSHPVSNETTQLAQLPRQPAGGATPAPQQQPLIVALSPEPNQPNHKIEAKGYLSVDQLPAGGRCYLAVEITIANGWHINTNPAVPDLVIPTELTLSSGQKIELKDVKYPPGTPFRIAGFDEAVHVYQGKIYLLGELVIPESASGKGDLSAQVRYQSCNDQTCLRPANFKLTGQIPIARKGAPVPRANAALFDRLLEKQKPR